MPGLSPLHGIVGLALDIPALLAGGALDAPPKGWGFHPVAPLCAVRADHLPELPLLGRLPVKQQTPVIVRALSPLPYLYRTPATAVASRYNLSATTAWDVLHRAKGIR